MPSQLCALRSSGGSRPLTGRDGRRIFGMIASPPTQMRLEGGIEQLLQQLLVFTLGTEKP